MQVKSKGILIEYRLPTIPERLRLLASMGAKPGAVQDELDYATLANMIEGVGGLVTSVSAKHDGKVVTSWDDLLKIESMTECVMDVVTGILNPTTKTKAKKS